MPSILIYPTPKTSYRVRRVGKKSISKEQSCSLRSGSTPTNYANCIPKIWHTPPRKISENTRPINPHFVRVGKSLHFNLHHIPLSRQIYSCGSAEVSSMRLLNRQRKTNQ